MASPEWLQACYFCSSTTTLELVNHVTLSRIAQSTTFQTTYPFNYYGAICTSCRGKYYRRIVHQQLPCSACGLIRRRGLTSDSRVVEFMIRTNPDFVYQTGQSICVNCVIKYRDSVVQSCERCHESGKGVRRQVITGIMLCRKCYRKSSRSTDDETEQTEIDIRRLKE